jgi:hypothetical protein
MQAAIGASAGPVRPAAPPSAVVRALAVALLLVVPPTAGATRAAVTPFGAPAPPTGAPAPPAGAPAPPAGAPAPPAGTTRLELGLEERVRTENWDDLTDFDHAALDVRHQWRFRTRVWARLGRGPSMLAAGLNNESRRLTTPRAALQMDETVFETLYLEHRFPGSVTVRAGRQNLVRGDGLVLLDGGPLDGSRTAYFNALDVGWTRGARQLDLLLVSNPDRDQYLPPIHDRRRPLLEWDERAVGLYGSDASRPHLTLEAYGFFKTQTGDTRPLAHPSRQADRRFHTVGARLTRDVAPGWSLVAEAAGQLGRQDPDRDVRAWALQGSVRKGFASARLRQAVMLGWVALSGDDPATAANEAWDPLFSRWPKWSELVLYTLAVERGAGYWTNLSMGIAEVRSAPVRSVEIRVAYQRLGAGFAEQGARTYGAVPVKPAAFGTGTHRGDLLAARADLRVDEHWRAHVVGEWFAPGDFYAGSDAAWFLRAEILYTFQHVFGR